MEIFLKMQDRITTIENYKSNLGERKKSIDKRLRHVTLLKYFSAAFTLLVILIVLRSFLPIDLLNDKLEWNDSALLIVLSFTYLLQGPKYFYESKLLRHLQKLKNDRIESPKNNDLNNQLQNMISDINNDKNKWWIIAYMILLMIASLIQMISDNFQYWNYFKIPFLLFLTLILFNFFKTYDKLSRNIKEYEG